MTPELEELVRLYAAALEAPESEQKRKLAVFLQRCREIAEQRKLREDAVSNFASTTYHKQKNADDKRLGRR